MKRLLQRYDSLWFAQSTGARLGAFRILFALYMLAYFGVLAPHVTILFSNEGVYVPYLVPDLAPGPLLAALLFFGMLALTLLLLVGYRTQLVASLLLALFLHHYLLQLAEKESSFERLIIIYLAVLCLAGAGQRFGLDETRAPQTKVVWAERLIAAQSILLYTGSGLWKILNPSWHDGALLRSTFIGMWATPLAFDIAQLGMPPWAWTMGSWLVILLELSLGPALFFRRTRPFAIAGALAFHVGNCVLLFIPEFLVSVTPLVVFVDEARIERYVAPRWARACAWARARADSFRRRQDGAA